MTTRLDSISEQLKARGVVDVKLTFEPGALESRTYEELADSVADMLDSYLQGKTTQRDFSELDHF